MLPGKKLTPEDLARIIKRRFWIIVVPFAVVSAATAVVARKLPETYRSDVVIAVVPQRVPESFVRSTVVTPIEDRLQAIAQTILSRPRLEKIITDFNLYADERRTGIMEDIIQQMRTVDIQMIPLQGDAFRVSFRGADRRTTQLVTKELGDLFISESLRDRTAMADNTSTFLQSQVDEHRRSLLDLDQRLQAYREQHAGELPEQLTANQNALNNVQSQIRGVRDALANERQSRLILQSRLGQLENMATDAAIGAVPVAPSADGLPQPGQRMMTTAEQLALARAQVTALQTRNYTASHPTMRSALGLVAQLEKKLEAEALQTPLSATTPQPTTPTEARRLQTMQALNAEIALVDAQIASKLDEEKRLMAEAAAIQERINRTPTRQTELMDLTRDYDQTRLLYNDLSNKNEQSKIAANLERRQIGEQFKVIDPARIPERPVSPDRPLINTMGLVGGLFLGIGLAALLEYRDAGLRTDEDVAGLLALPVLAVVPLMRSKRERRRRRWRRVALSVALASMVLGCFAVVGYTFIR